jgi:hypothetical protein
MAADVQAMADAAEQGFLPGSPAELLAVLQALPWLFEMIGTGLHGLAEYMKEQGGEVLGKAGEDMHEVAGIAEDAFEAASDIYLLVQPSAGFWLGGGD